jgi:cyclic 2,3-diphosphoglycerate synthetase
MRVLVLVDGEHYPPVTRWGIASARTMGYEVLAALFVGGAEKIASGPLPDLGVDVLDAREDPMAALAAAIEERGPEGVLDLSDEPVLGYRDRMRLASVALRGGVAYVGSDFRLDAPRWGPSLPVPSVGVIGTGKRTGKTALAAELARAAGRAGRRPVIVAMGRGGPPAPQVADPKDLTVERLVEVARAGEHAASDYLEDALFAGVPAVGARRCGGGLAGRAFVTNGAEAVQVALGLGADLVILEGSGSSMPPLLWDAGVLVAPATVPEEHVAGYLGPLRILLTDLFVVTMANGPSTGPDLLSLRSHVRAVKPDAGFVVTDFEPDPLGDVEGKTVFLTTTAPGKVAGRQAKRLERSSGCRIAGVSGKLADRAGLRADLAAAPEYDVLVTELKGAAVDVACEDALARGAEVVFMQNRPVSVPGEEELATALEKTVEMAVDRHGRRR